MKVILLQDIAKLGYRGEVKEVADGFATNVLIRKKQAVQVTPSELAKWKQLQDKKQYEKDLAESSFARLAEELKSTKLVIENIKHDNNHLFAAIGKDAIVDAIFKATKLSINPQQIVFTSPLKTIGEHTFTLVQGEKKATVAITLIGKK